MKKIFISYAQKDSYFDVKTLVEQLSAHKYEVIWDKGTIEIGDHQINAIKRGITECDYVISILTLTSYKRPWILRELYEAVLQEKIRGQKVLLPILVEPLEREKLTNVASYDQWLKTDPFFYTLPHANNLDSIVQELDGLQHFINMNEENYSILPIVENGLEIYRTNDLLQFTPNSKLKYVKTVGSYLLTGFEKGVEFKHFVKCNTAERQKVKDILGQYSEICVSGSGEPHAQDQWLVWFLDRRSPITTKLSDPYCNNIE